MGVVINAVQVILLHPDRSRMTMSNQEKKASMKYTFAKMAAATLGRTALDISKTRTLANEIFKVVRQY